jgi:CRP-like cAMP-binding protein
MALDDDIGFLNKIPTFRLLGGDGLRIIAISAEAIRMNSGDLLFEEGEQADSGYVVVDGAIVLRSTQDQAGVRPTVAGPGTLIGEMALIVETRRPATASAVKPSTVWRIPRGIFMRVLEGEPRAAVALRRMISERVGSLINDLDVVLPLFDDGAQGTLGSS